VCASRLRLDERQSEPPSGPSPMSRSNYKTNPIDAVRRFANCFAILCKRERFRQAADCDKLRSGGFSRLPGSFVALSHVG
jgi:hypothetical protein